MHSINNREDIIALSIRHLRDGHVLLTPTDTIWGLACAAFNEKAIDRIFELKQRPRQKGLILLVASIKMLKEYVGTIPVPVRSVIDLMDAPTTVIYPKAQLPNHLVADDGSVAIRIVQHQLIKDIISAFGEPIISTSANFSGQASPMDLQSVHPELARSVHFCIPSQFDTSDQKIPSRIIKVEDDGTIKHLR